MKECFTYEIPIRSTASTVVGLSHRGSRVETHAAAAMRQPYSGPMGVFAVVEKRNGTERVHYVLKDHLGSWTTITDANGNIEQEVSFDAWGNPRDAETWSGSYNGALMFDRSFTGHEHLNSSGLINMNGRMYDPVMSSFLSVDNYVQQPDNSQNFNRYAYCLNNPLKYTDPIGELFGIDDIMFSMIVYGISSVMINGVVNTCVGKNFYDGSYGAFMGSVTSVGVGGVMGGVASKMVGVGFVPGGIVQGTGGLFGGYVGGAVGAWCNGGSLRDCMTAGLTGGAIGLGTGLVLGGIQGGIYAMKNGGNFWTGKGATFDQISASTIPGTPVDYDQVTAEQFSKENFGDNISGLRKLYADGSVPPETDRFKWVKAKDGVYKYEKIKGEWQLLGKTNGSTRYISGKFFRSSDVYLYESAFCSKEQLYLTMGHEYIHCGFNIDKSLGNPTLSTTRARQEASCYQWEIQQARAWGLESYANHMEGIYKSKYSMYYNGKYQPSIPVLPIRPWL